MIFSSGMIMFAFRKSVLVSNSRIYKKIGYLLRLYGNGGEGEMD